MTPNVSDPTSPGRIRNTAPMEIVLPYPDFKESAAVLNPHDLLRQIENVTLLMEYLLEVKHPTKEHSLQSELMLWRGHEMQLAEYGLTCIEELKGRKVVTTGVDQLEHRLSWALEMASEDENMTKPAWFGDMAVHLSWQRWLIIWNPLEYREKFEPES